METDLAVRFFLAHLQVNKTVLQTKFEQLEKLPNSAVQYCPLPQGAVTAFVNSSTQL